MSNSGGGIGNHRAGSRQSTTTNANTTTTSQPVANKGRGVAALHSTVTQAGGVTAGQGATVNISRSAHGAIQAGSAIALAGLHGGVSALRDAMNAENSIVNRALSTANSGIAAAAGANSSLSGLTAQTIAASAATAPGQTTNIGEMALLVAGAVGIFLVVRKK